MKKLFIFIFLAVIITSIFGIDMTDQKAAKFADWLTSKGINPYIIVVLLAMLPIFELRGSIPVGILVMKLDVVQVIIWSVIGNMIPIFFILFFFGPIEKLLRKISFFNKFFDWLFARTKAKSASIEKYEEIGLMLFVGIPLPLTGAWTGCLAAYIFKLSYLSSLFYIFLGVLIACAIVVTLTLLWQVGAVILAVCCIVFIYVSIKGIVDSIKARKNAKAE